MAGKSPLSNEQWQALYERALAGEKPGDLDRECGFSKGTVGNMLTRRFGYVRRRQAPPMSREQSDAIHERVQRGESLGAIARELGMGNASGNLYRLMMNRYGYKAEDVRYRAVWAPTIKLDWAKDVDLAYAAGIIDGEGSIMHLSKSRSNPIWVVRVGMTDRPVIEWMHQFGGAFGTQPPAKGGHKEQYKWSLSRQLDVKAFLRAILPYMKVKHDRAREALADLDTGLVRKCDWTEAEIAGGGLNQGCGTYPRSAQSRE